MQFVTASVSLNALGRSACPLLPFALVHMPCPPSWKPSAQTESHDNSLSLDDQALAGISSESMMIAKAVNKIRTPRTPSTDSNPNSSQLPCLLSSSQTLRSGATADIDHMPECKSDSMQCFADDPDVEMAKAMPEAQELALPTRKDLDARSVARIFTQPGVDPSEKAFNGLVLQIAPDALELPGTACLRAMQVTKRYPIHCLFELRFYIAPLIAALVPTVLLSVVSQIQASAADDKQGTMRDISEMRELSWLIGSLDFVLIFLDNVAVWVLPVVLICMLWSWKTMRKVIFKFSIPTFVLCSLGWTAGFVIRRTSWNSCLFAHVHTSRLVGLAIEKPLLFVGAAGTLVTAGKVSKNPWFGWTLALALGSAMTIHMGYTQCARFLLSASDEVKAIFVIFINPVLAELPLIMLTRFIARALRNNHPSTSFMIMTPALAFKQMIGRFVMATIKSPTWVLVLSMMAGLGEFIFRVTANARDRILYTNVFRRWLKHGEEAYAQMKNPRNKHLRANVAMFESMSEIVNIWNGVALVLLLDISKDGYSPPCVWKTVLGGIIQTGTEYLVDYFSLAYLAAFQNLDILGQARGRRWYWSIGPSFMIMWAVSETCVSLLPEILYRAPGTHEARWIIQPS